MPLLCVALTGCQSEASRHERETEDARAKLEEASNVPVEAPAPPVSGMVIKPLDLLANPAQRAGAGVILAPTAASETASAVAGGGQQGVKAGGGATAAGNAKEFVVRGDLRVNRVISPKVTLYDVAGANGSTRARPAGQVALVLPEPAFAADLRREWEVEILPPVERSDAAGKAVVVPAMRFLRYHEASATRVEAAKTAPAAEPKRPVTSPAEKPNAVPAPAVNPVVPPATAPAAAPTSPPASPSGNAGTHGEPATVESEKSARLPSPTPSPPALPASQSAAPAPAGAAGKPSAAVVPIPAVSPPVSSVVAKSMQRTIAGALRSWPAPAPPVPPGLRPEQPQETPAKPPAAVAAKPARGNLTPQAEIEQALTTWAANLKMETLEVHLAFYAQWVTPYFLQKAGVSRQYIRAEKTRLLATGTFAGLHVSNIAVRLHPPDGAVVTMKKSWETVDARNRRTARAAWSRMWMTRGDTGWHITGEQDLLDRPGH